MKYTPIIGLEVHVELKTKSKMFCSCLADYFGKEPNTHTCPVCLGLPGALPVPNKTAIEWCIKIAHALGCQINEVSKFDRKNYFYPDLPKGYQISQYDLPFGKNGSITLSSGTNIGITRVHMEEDTAKLTHQFGIKNSKVKSQNDEKVSLIDFNRSGVPLVEVVTEPDFHTSKEVKEYLQNLQRIVRFLEVSNADMEKGEMRLEPNISLTTDLGKLPPYKVEVKNINSFRFVERAIEFELTRQAEILDSGETPTQETRGWSEQNGTTVSQRIKEEANDYRYFPEPDIPPITFSKDRIEEIRQTMPELPEIKRERFKSEYNLSEYDAEILTRNPQEADKFEAVVKQGADSKQLANGVINKKIDLSLKMDKIIIMTRSLNQTAEIDTNKLQSMITKVVSENEKAVTEYKNGKDQVLMFLVGQVMQNFPEKIDAQKVKEILEKHIK